MSSLRAVTCFGAAALLGLAMVTEGAVLKWSDHQASIVPPEEQSGLGGSGRSTGPVQPINLTNVDGSGINITVTATIGDRAETEEYVDSVFISGTPSYRTDQISTGGYGVFVEAHPSARDLTNLYAASATVEITFSQPVKDLSFIYAGLRDQGPRHQQVTFFADGSDEGFSFSFNEETALEQMGTNGVKGIANLSGGTDAKGVVFITLDGPVTTLTYIIENVPDVMENSNAYGAMGASIGDITFTPVPEPAALSVLGLGGLALMRRRRMA